MKKYWVSIVISVVIITSIGTFYIQSVFATNNIAKFTVEKQEGDEQEIASLFMMGFYFDKSTYDGLEFELDLEGTTYWKEKSFFERIDGLYRSPQIKQLQKEHRNFMRGKYGSINSYFENEEALVYADVSYRNPYTVSSDFEFTIAILDKKTDKTTLFKQLVPNGGDFWYLDVFKVQMLDGQLKVITQNDVREDDREEIHLYTFDITKESLVSDKVILSTEETEDKYISITQLSIDDETNESEYIAFVKTTTNIEEEGFIEDVGEEELIIYNLALDRLEAVNPESIGGYGYPEHLDGENIYLTEIDENGVLKIAVYDIKSEQIVDHFDVGLSNRAEGQSVIFNDGKLYIVDSYINFETPAIVTVIDLKNGETLFEGEIKNTDQNNAIDQVELSIHEVLFK